MFREYPKKVLQKYHGMAVGILERADMKRYPPNDPQLYHAIFELLYENDTAFMDALELYLNAKLEQEGKMEIHDSIIQQMIRLDDPDSIKRAAGWLRECAIRSRNTWEAFTGARVLAFLRADNTACGQWFVYPEREEFFTNECMKDSAKFMSQVLRSCS